MKKNISILMLFTALVWILSSCSYIRKSVDAADAAAYLEKTYQREFVLLEEHENEDNVVFTFCTDDDNAIVFEVHGWIGGMNTLAGTLTIIPQKHFIDNFPDRIAETVVDPDRVLHMNEKTLDDIVDAIKTEADKVQNMYERYGLEWQKPHLRIWIEHNGITAQVEYSGQDEHILRDSLIKTFYT